MIQKLDEAIQQVDHKNSTLAGHSPHPLPQNLTAASPQPGQEVPITPQGVVMFRDIFLAFVKAAQSADPQQLIA
eukprot:12102001-Karenia_brevis.AAC.1